MTTPKEELATAVNRLRQASGLMLACQSLTEEMRAVAKQVDKGINRLEDLILDATEPEQGGAA